ncbi:MAG TPA: hypothetical protein VMW04_01875 [Patescibacteria group bacterium]|nr:hypothetical protein [Patescibacteria group bacterium]
METVSPPEQAPEEPVKLQGETKTSSRRNFLLGGLIFLVFTGVILVVAFLNRGNIRKLNFLSKDKTALTEEVASETPTGQSTEAVVTPKPISPIPTKTPKSENEFYQQIGKNLKAVF